MLTIKPIILLESSFSGYFQNLHKKKFNSDDLNRDNNMIKSREYQKYASTLDRISRVVFPLSFALFNLVYWLFYLNSSINSLDGFTILFNRI